MGADAEVTGAPRQDANLRFIAALARVLAPLSFLILLAAYLSYRNPHFHQPGNLKEIAAQASVVAILACGQTAVIISGNIDLSVAAIMALAGVVAALQMRSGAGMGLGIAIACAIGLIVGCVNGLIRAFGKIPSFIVTLGMMGIARGIAGVMSGSENISVPDRYVKLIGAELFGSDTRNGIPYAVLMMIGAALIVHVLLTRTRRGRAMYALGGNEEASRLSGIPMVYTTTFVFALAGLLSGFAAVVQLARASVASRDAGMNYELYAVAAAVIGGTSLTGGQGGVPGTIIGAFLIYTIYNGCVLLDYPPDYQTAIIGLVVVLAVLYDHFDLGARSIYAVLRLFGRRIDMKR